MNTMIAILYKYAYDLRLVEKNKCLNWDYGWQKKNL